ncbi:nuclear transport factor 2 family protein [Paenibacillus tuaregi]|uniref:nuclear transport factor 2 family protein n=1 Tax=Paenibacillus tuaregi TaxID=1816681 RepID=UPI000838D2A1|nr:nuclear transport factor 2 family protein [Paenibacillus tuaregi]
MKEQEVVIRFLEAEAKQDVQVMAGLMADDIVYETPFALPGVPERVVGKETLADMLEQFIGKEGGMYATWSIYNIRIYPSYEPGLLTAEMDGQGIVAGSEHLYRQSYISLFRVTDGRISLWREYFNPLALQQALASLHTG